MVYSITDRRSFSKAIDLLHDIRRDERLSPAIMVLVANKADLVRSRLVGEQGIYGIFNGSRSEQNRPG